MPPHLNSLHHPAQALDAKPSSRADLGNLKPPQTHTSPADIYLVRIFNNSGDVNQGQGLVYGSSLILAYTQCEGKLAYLQASQPDKKWRMVINMSVGAPGPLTIEKLFFQ